MNATTAQEMRDVYLRRLDTAISDIPHGLAVELRAGIAEELRSDDPEALAARIRELGDPEEVAQAAIEAGFGGPQSTPIAAPEPTPITTSSQAPAVLPLTETRGFAVTSAIILGVGGIIIPFVGWIVGACLVSNSKLWSKGEKFWAILVPPLTLLVAVLVGVVSSSLGSSADNIGTPGNPLLPATYDIVWSIILIGAIVAPFTALWLVLRLRRRTLPEKTLA